MWKNGDMVAMLKGAKNKPAFHNHHRKLSAEFMINVDFEAMTTKLAGSVLDPKEYHPQNAAARELSIWLC